MSSRLGIKHLVECHCTLKIYEGRDDHLFHKFPVYSKLDNKGKIIQKLAQCNNCNTFHKVYDICKSDIIRSGKDALRSTVSLEDIKYQLPSKLNNVLSSYDVDFATWEQVLDICENNLYEQSIVLSREVIDEKYHVKILTMVNEDRIKITTEVIENTVEV